MKLVIFTLVLDGMPYIYWHLPIFEKLKCDWQWEIVHGAAMPTGSTSWCQLQDERLSNDGTTEYLNKISHSYRINVTAREMWESKDEMANEAIRHFKEDYILMQIDVDEIHSPENIDKIMELFTNDPQLGAIRMPCRFFVGSRLICKGENCWSNKRNEWERVWRYRSDDPDHYPGDHEMHFQSHEPPIMAKYLGRIMQRDEAKSHGLSFDHYAYAIKKQAEYKEKFYGYDGLVNQWTALQDHDHFPEPLQRFFPFVDDKVMVDRL